MAILLILLVLLALPAHAAATVSIQDPNALLRSESLAYCQGEDEPALDSILLSQVPDWRFEFHADTGMAGECGEAGALSGLAYETLASSFETRIDLDALVAVSMGEDGDLDGFASGTARMSFQLLLDDTRDVVVAGSLTSFRGGGEGSTCTFAFEDVVAASSAEVQVVAAAERLSPGSYLVLLDCSGLSSKRNVNGTLVGGGASWASAELELTLTRVDSVPVSTLTFGAMKAQFR